MKNAISVFSTSGRVSLIGRYILSSLVFVVFQYGAQTSFAAPVVSGIHGSVLNGQQVTISGSGFGIKNPAAPVLWASFNNNITPSSLGQTITWKANSSGIVYSSSGGYSGGAAHVYADAHSSEMLVMATVGWYFNDPGQKSYIHRRVKRMYDSSADYLGGNGGLKSLLLDYNSTYADSVVMNRSTNQWITQNLGSSYYYFPADNNKLDWQVEEAEIQANTVSGQSCIFKTYIDHSLVKSSPTSGSISLWNTGDQPLNNLSFWRYASSSPRLASEVDEYWDDLYVDNTWSRVILGNASTLSTSTQREIQVPTNWTDGSVTISVNAGKFTSGQSVYLYVIDSSGTVNSFGYLVTVGTLDSTSETQPAPVLKVIKSL